MAEINGRGHTATIKYGTGYDAPWLVLTADTIEGLQSEVEAATGVAAGELTLADHIAQAAIRAQGMWSAAQSLGATPVPAPTPAKKGARRAPAKKADADPAPTPAPAPAPAEKPADVEPPFEPDPPVQVGSAQDIDPIVAALDAVTNMDEFRKVWQANQAAFKRPEIAAHAKATRARLDGAA